MNDEESKQMLSSRGKKYKSLSEHWVQRYILENNLYIKDPRDIDSFSFALWLQARPVPSIGQKRNIATAVKKIFGIKISIFGKPREISQMINPSRETYKSTLDALSEFFDNAPVWFENIRILACIAFICTSKTGLSIKELMRSEISDKQKINPGNNDVEKEKYEITVSVSHDESITAYNSRVKKIYLVCSAHGIESFEQYFKMLKEAGSSNDCKKVISKIQYIIATHNTAKGCSLRQLRKIYPEILRKPKSTG
jgi:hypothetical protein